MDLSYFVDISETAFKDLDGVYLDDKKIAVNNGSRNGYVRYADGLTFDPKSLCSGEYNVATELIFVGAVPGCDEDTVYLEVMQAAGCSDTIQSITFDKGKIAKSEGIDRQQLAKFSGITLVMMKYTQTEFKIYDPNCDYDIC